MSRHVVDNLMQGWDRLVQGYNANQSNRFKRIQSGLPASGASADYHYRSEAQYLQLIEMSRDFERNSPIIKAAFNRLQSNIIQDGFTLDVQVDQGDIDKRLTEKWLDWASTPEKCDASGELSFPEIECLAFRSMARDGDCMEVGLSDGTLRTYEGHRCRTPRNTTRNVIHGVLLNEMRQRIEYWFTKDDIDPWRSVDKVSDMTAIPTRDANGNRQVFHVYNPDRFSQTRGIGWCVPSLDTIGMHDDIEFAKMVQQKVVSCFTIFLERSDDWTPEATPNGDVPTRTDYINGLQRQLQDLFPGKLLEGLPGEKLQGFSPNVPNAEFFQHAMLLLTFIAANLDLPLQVLLLDPKQTNFSGWRGAIDQARLRFQQLQSLMIKRLHGPVYRWKVRQWLRTEPWLQEAAASGELNIFAHEWKAPGWDYIERMTDAQADSLMLASGLDSRRRLLARRGLREDQVRVESTDDNKERYRLAIIAALELNEEFGEQLKKFNLPYIDYNAIAAMPLATGVTMQIAPQQAPPEPAAEGGDAKKDDGGKNRVAALNGSAH